MKECSGISNLIPKPAHHLTLFSDEAFERSKTAAILTDNDISHRLSSQSVEDNFKDALKILRIRNLNKFIISQININSIRNKIELLSEAVLGDIDILMVSEIKVDMSFLASQFVIQGFSAPFRLIEQMLAEEYSSMFKMTFLPNYRIFHMFLLILNAY